MSLKLLAIRSIPLSEETREGWHSAGVKFAKRRRSDAEIQRIIDDYGYDAAINLGDRGFSSATTPVWNELETVLAVMDTGRLRVTLDDDKANAQYMPPRTLQGPHWHKRLGWGGAGVRYCEEYCGRPDGEYQSHINGDEYRVITVADKIVQASRKTNARWVANRHAFDFGWVGVGGINDLGIIPLLKEAVELVPHWERSVLGWDVIRGSRPYIIECNTSFGVNPATAQRVVSAMEVANDSVTTTV